MRNPDDIIAALAATKYSNMGDGAMKCARNHMGNVLVLILDSYETYGSESACTSIKACAETLDKALCEHQGNAMLVSPVSHDLGDVA